MWPWRIAAKVQCIGGRITVPVGILKEKPSWLSYRLEKCVCMNIPGTGRGMTSIVGGKRNRDDIAVSQHWN